VCALQKVDCLVLERRAIENYLNPAVAREVLDKPDANDFGHFSKPDSSWDWNKEKNWRIAERMTREDLAPTDLGAFLDKLAATVLANTTPSLGNSGDGHPLSHTSTAGDAPAGTL
jgi:hypothetical protein